MAKSNVLTIRVPSDLKERIKIAAEQQGVSINQLAINMFAREVSSFEVGNKMSEYWRGYGKEKVLKGFDTAMSKAKKRNVAEWDEIPSL